MLKSKLSDEYSFLSVEQLSMWLKGQDCLQLDPIFAGRLAYLAKSSKSSIYLTEGYRSKERQQELYELYKKGKLKSAAKPGTSWHEYRLAIDTSSYPLRGMNNEQLKKYGLCKPISYEGWHVQPIETLGLTGNSNRLKWQPIEVEDPDMTPDEVKNIIKIENMAKDKSVSEWARESWEKATQNKIVDGTSPRGQLTREQFVVVLDRLGLLDDK